MIIFEIVLGALLAFTFLWMVVRQSVGATGRVRVPPPVTPAAGTTPGVAPAAPVTPARFDWFGWPNSPFWKTIWAILLIALVVGAASAYWFNIDIPPWLLLGVKAVAAIAVGVVVIIILIRSIGSVGSGATWTATGSFPMKVLTAFMVITAVFYVLWDANPSSPLFNTPEGRNEVALYYILSLTAGMVGAHYAGWRAFVLGALMVFVFAWVGEKTKMLYDPEGKVFAQFFPGGGRGPTVVSETIVGCSNRARVDVLSRPMKVNNDDCVFHFGVINGPVQLSGPNGTVVAWPGKEALVPQGFMTRTAQAVPGYSVPTISHTSCDRQHNSRYDGQNCL